MQFRTIGILGGGQLGRMLTFAAKRMGMRVIILDPDPDAPAAQVADEHVLGDFRDAQKIRELAKLSDVLTVEIEHVDTAVLEALQNEGVAIQPSPQTIRIIQDKLTQKRHLSEHGIPIAPFQDTPSVEAAQAAGEALGYPFMLKARKLAYDGRGNAEVHKPTDLEEAFADLGGKDLYAEQWVPYEKELAVMVARGLDGKLAVYPVTESVHKGSILRQVFAPARVPDAIRTTAAGIAGNAIATFDGAGIFGVELFLLPDGEIFVNEIAPRPHNTGHYTIEACFTDQFEQHIRAILGLPLGIPDLKVVSASMLNILGAGDNAWIETTRPLQHALTLPGVSIHWYGKSSVRTRRKMGHITVIGPPIPEHEPLINSLTHDEADPKTASPLVGIIMGSDSDLPTMKEAASVLQDFGVAFELTIVSAHRTPQRMMDYAQAAHGRGLKVIIAGAGGAAHLPGMVAALTPLPVIGVPINSAALNGLDALLSIAQMPRGVPVATVAIGNATNAGLLAVRLLASSDPALQRKMIAYQEKMAATVMDKVDTLIRDGWEHFGKADDKTPGKKAPAKAKKSPKKKQQKTD